MTATDLEPGEVTMDDLERMIANWQRRRHGYAVDITRLIVKLGEEVGELCKAVLKGDRENGVEELADIVICCSGIATYFGTSLTEAVAAKLPVLEKRLEKKLKKRSEAN